MAEKLYLVTRKDLSAGAQAVQACHAFREYVAKFPEEERHWYQSSNHLALLATESLPQLEELAAKAEDRGFRVALFHEPDFEGALTAVALEPRAKKMLRALPLALG